MALRRYACPHCGGGLSRSLVHPKWLSLEAENPEFQMPLRPLLVAIVVLGLCLALIHPALSFLGVVVLANWIYWRYFSWLQCDSCSRYFFGGQLSGNPRATVPWTRSDLKRLAIKVAVAGGVILAVFLPLSYVEQATRKNCATECAVAGRDGQVSFNRCTCVSKAK
jgi:hypothetical protein